MRFQNQKWKEVSQQTAESVSNKKRVYIVKDGDKFWTQGTKDETADHEQGPAHQFRTLKWSVGARDLQTLFSVDIIFNLNGSHSE